MNYSRIKKTILLITVFLSATVVLGSSAHADLILANATKAQTGDSNLSGADAAFIYQTINSYIPGPVSYVLPVVDVTGEGLVTGADAGFAYLNLNGFDIVLPGRKIPMPPGTSIVAGPNFGKDLPILITDPVSGTTIGSTRTVSPNYVDSITFNIENTLGPTAGVLLPAISVKGVPITLYIENSTCAGPSLTATDMGGILVSGTTVGDPGVPPYDPGNPPFGGIPTVLVPGTTNQRGTVSVTLDVGPSGGCEFDLVARCDIYGFDTTVPAFPTIEWLKRISARIHFIVVSVGQVAITAPLEGECITTNIVDVTVSSNAPDGTTIQLIVNGTTVAETCNLSLGQCIIQDVFMSDGPKTLVASIPSATISPERHIIVDATPPGAPTITTPADGSTLCTTTVNTVISCDDSLDTCEERIDGGSWQTCGTGFVVGGSGIYTVEGRCIDPCGNISALASSTFAVDVTPPVVNITNFVIVHSMVTVEGIATDIGGSGIFRDGVTAELPGATETPKWAPLDVGGNWSATFYVPAGGSYTITALVEDGCGWIGIDSVTITIPIPVVTIISPIEGECINSSNVCVDAIEDGGEEVACTMDGYGPINPASICFTGVADGEYTITCSATNIFGYSDSDTVAITVDATPPVVTIIAPTCINGPTVVVNGTVTDPVPSSGLPDYITVELPGSNEVTEIVPIVGGVWSATFTGLVTGPYTATASIQDICGNTGSESVDFYVDLDPPTVDVDPLACQTTGNVTVSAICDDVDSGLATCEVSIDDGASWFPSPHLYVGLPDGDYTAIGRATDNCGNTASDMVGETFEVDTAVAVTITYPVAGVTVVAGDLTVTGTADTDITTVTVTSDQGHSESSAVDPGGNWSVVLIGVTVPSIAITATGTDDCGNIGSDTVTAPVVPPVCLIVSAEPTTGCPGVQVTITGTGFGPIAG
ncbi:MAG: hypothetical protein JSU92_02095, partial [Deltaproteobacteria bacterium]